ncbi:hypothetical protein CDAR_253091 [Caerostris darwini]|uniref:Uncharacterized protein n=1 Tax=Caerostris darwini TaxID=1538125 RepID=A0AAV4RBU5_9ARAC|nr:hypothetical protein CDAR_253091 [Caerostris darwini]
MNKLPQNIEISSRNGWDKFQYSLSKKQRGILLPSATNGAKSSEKMYFSIRKENTKASSRMKPSFSLILFDLFLDFTAGVRSAELQYLFSGFGTEHSITKKFFRALFSVQISEFVTRLAAGHACTCSQSETLPVVHEKGFFGSRVCGRAACLTER